jgi:hypothetical protein
VQDPLSFPFVWGGNDYGGGGGTGGSLESNVGQRTVTVTGDPDKPMYLNLVLDTKTELERRRGRVPVVGHVHDQLTQPAAVV